MRHQKAVAVDIDPRHLIAEVRFEHDARLRTQALDNDVTGADVRELERAFVAVPSDARVVQIHISTQSTHGQAASIRLPSLTELAVGAGLTVEGLGWRLQGTGFGIWDLGFGIWDMGFGIWDLGFGIWDLGFGI